MDVYIIINNILNNIYYLYKEKIISHQALVANFLGSSVTLKPSALLRIISA